MTAFEPGRPPSAAGGRSSGTSSSSLSSSSSSSSASSSSAGSASRGRSSAPKPRRAAVRAAAPGEPVRPPLAVLVSRFPLITETFILRELVELERQGQPVRLVPLIREEPQVVHAEAEPWMQRALTSPFVSVEVLAANLRVLRRRPVDYLSTLWLLLSGTLTSWNFLVRTLLLFPKAVWLSERLELEGIGHVHAHFATHPTTVALAISKLTDITFSFTAHAHDIFVRQQLLEEKLRRASAVRTVSDFNRSWLESRYPEAAAGKIELIRVGIAVDAYGREPARDRTPVAFAGRSADGARAAAGASRPARLLSVAALRPYKGLRFLIEACVRLRRQGLDFRCEVVGEGPERERLERRIVELGLVEHVHLLGARPQDEVRELLAAADVFVLPSVRAPDGQMEGLPVAIMEAMASGLPVVASSLSGIPELVVDGDTGVLVEPGDAGDLADALRGLLEDRAGARRMATRARARVEAMHRLDASVEQLVDLLSGLDTPPHAAPPEAARRLVDGAREGPLGVHLRGPLGIRRCRQSADSLVVELLAPAAASRELALKRPLSRVGQSRPPLERARREFEVLRRLDDAGLGVPRPLGLDTQLGALLMERCAGRRLDRRVRDLRLRLDAEAGRRLASACRQAGRWLRRFQRLPLEDRGAEVEDLVGDRLAEAGQLLEHCRGAGLLPPGGRDLLGWLEMLRVSIDLRRLGPVPVHGDFWPGNVFVAEAAGGAPRSADGAPPAGTPLVGTPTDGAPAIQVVDFEGHGVGLRWEDAASFLVHLELYFAYPLLRLRGGTVADGFLAGFLESDVPDEAAARFCRVLAALRVLAHSADGHPRSLPAKQRRLLRQIVLGD